MSNQLKINHCYQGDCRDAMRQILEVGGAGKVQTIITSPPYWGLRDYGVSGQLGQEATLQEFLANMVEVFDLCWQLLADDGTLWLNMGDSYAANRSSQPIPTNTRNKTGHVSSARVPKGLKPKDLVGQPWRLAFALQDAGWYLRQDIIWHKPNPMPESVTDRCTKAHEYIFLLSKSPNYYYDNEAVKELGVGTEYDKTMRPQNRMKGARYLVEGKGQTEVGASLGNGTETRNKRSVWTIPTHSYTGAHFATFPKALVEPCILAGSRPGDIVFDPFMGSGTVAEVAQNLGRKWIGTEINPEYIKLQNKRASQLGLELAA